MKRIYSICMFLVILFAATSATARGLNFMGFRPKTAEIPTYKLSIGVPLIPYMGFGNVRSFGDIPVLVDAISNLQMPDDGDLFTNMRGFIDNVNTLHGKNVSLKGLVMPIRILGINTKWFELTLDGGVVNITTARITGLKNRLEYSDILFDEWWTPYLDTKKQNLMSFRSMFLMGGDLWAIAKVPIKVGKYTITPLAGVGATLAYSYMYRADVLLEDEVTVYSGFTSKDYTSSGFVWAIHGVLGAQFDMPKYLKVRTMFQFRGKTCLSTEIPDLSPMYNLGISAQIWKIGTVSAEVLDMEHPEYRVEFSRSFGINSEAAIGGIFNSEYFGKAMAYVVLGLGGEPVKVTTTVLTDGNQVGLLFGVTVGYMPR